MTEAAAHASHPPRQPRRREAATARQSVRCRFLSSRRGSAAISSLGSRAGSARCSSGFIAEACRGAGVARGTMTLQWARLMAPCLESGLGARAEANGRTLGIARRGLWGPAVEATDGAGGTVGQFRARGVRGGGALRWIDRELMLCPTSRGVSASRSPRATTSFHLRGQARPAACQVTVDGPSALDPGFCSSRPSSCADSGRTPAPPRERRRRVPDTRSLHHLQAAPHEVG